MNYKQALGLGFELSSFFLASYFFYPGVAQYFQWDPGVTLSLLLGVSLVLWTVHAFVYFNSQGE